MTINIYTSGQIPNNIVNYFEKVVHIYQDIYIILDGLEGDTRIYCQRC